MSKCRLHVVAQMASFAGIILFLFSLQTPVHALIVDFEFVPTIATGPTTFAAAGPAQTINVNGVVTFSGGVVLGVPTNFPASPFSTPPNVYGTAKAPDYGFSGDPSLSSSLSVSISPTLTATTVEGLLFNGIPQAVSYTINAYSGSTLVDSVSFPNLQSNLSSGFTTFRLNSGGPSISSVLFNPDTRFTGGQWDYVIDTIAIGEPIENVAVVPVPAAVVLFGSGLIGLLGSQWKRLRKMV